MQGAMAAYLDGGARLHLQHGPIDLIVGAEGETREARGRAFAAAHARFEDILGRLVEELPVLRAPLSPATYVNGPVAQRMVSAGAEFLDIDWMTPMIAVAGSVADEVLAAMVAATPLTRAYVNNGGDIALHLAKGRGVRIAMSHETGARLGEIDVTAGDGIGGIATSGAGGRSYSLGIADSVTVLAHSAAAADTAATLIANAVDLPSHPGILRQPARLMSPDSDLGARLVVTGVPVLTLGEIDRALSTGARRAQRLLDTGRIAGAALTLGGHTRCLGQGFSTHPQLMESADV